LAGGSAISSSNLEKILPNLQRIAWALCLLVAAALSIKSLQEPDLWWMLRTGEWIVENGRVVDRDVFSFTFSGVPWINVKWLFEVVAYGMQRLGGPEFTLLLQTAVNLSALLFIFKIARDVETGLGQRTQFPSAGLIVVSYLVLFLWEYRINGRPEMISHLFTLIMIHLYLKNRIETSLGIYWLIPLMVAWTNLHEAYGTGIVIIVVMCAASVAEWFCLNRFGPGPPVKISKHLLLASTAAVAAISINPRGPGMILHPFEIFSQVGENKFTTELSSFETPYYWQQKEPYFAVGIFVVCLIAIFLFTYIPKDGSKARPGLLIRMMEPIGIGYIALLPLFAYLGLTAHRNIVFFILISAPLLIASLDAAGDWLLTKRPRASTGLQASVYGSLCVIGIAFYLSVVTNAFYTRLDSNQSYGLRVAEEQTPVGAAMFMQANGIDGTGFTDYLVSSYLMWELRPKYKTFIDLRDLDVFSADFFRAFAAISAHPDQLFPKLEVQYPFEHAVVFQPKFAA